MPNNTGRQLAMAKFAGLSMLLATALWMLLLIITAVQARQSAGAYEVSLGPLVFNRIVRGASENGMTVSLSFENGLFLYFLLSAAAGAALGYLSSRRA
jgi:hypothetical protein